MKNLLYTLLFAPLALFGQENYSLSFDGIDDYVELGILSPFNQNESLSLEVKFKWNGVLDSQGQYILQFAQSGPGNITIALDNNGQLSGGILQCNCEADDASYLYYQIEPNEWYHVIYSYDTSNGDSKLWVNNNLVGEGNYPFNSYYNVNNSPSRVGNYHFNSYHFNGNIAYAQIVNDVLQPSLSSLPHENTIGCWDFNEGSGTTLVDLSGNGNHGVINGAIYSDDVPEQNSYTDACSSFEESLSEGLITYFTFCNSLDDISNGGNNGSAIGDIVFENDRFGHSLSSLRLNNEDAIVCTTNSFNDPETFSISFWFKGDVVNEGHKFISTFDNGQCQHNFNWDRSIRVSNNELIFYAYPSGSLSAEGQFLDNNWHHTVLTFGEYGTLLYVDGQLLASDGNNNAQNYVGWWRIGGLNSNAFTGLIDDWALWDRQLSESEVVEIYNQTVLGCSDSLALNYNSEAIEDDGSCEYNNNNDTTASISYSLSLDGIDDYIDITSSLNYQSNIGTISVSFKLDDAHISQTYDLPLFMIDNGLSDPIVIRVGQSLCDAPGASLSFSNDDCGQSSPEVKAYWGNDATYLYDGNWHNITLVVGDDYHEIYLDGSKLELIYTIGNESVGSFLYGAETDLFYFGKRDLDDYSSFFQGYMNNIQIWNTALTQTKIQYYMNCDPAGTEEGLVGYWNFNEGSGDTVYDLSGNGNDGTIYGATYSEDVPDNNCIEGCVDTLAVNYNDTANVDDGSCVSVEEYTIDSLEMANQALLEESSLALSSLQQALDTWNTTIDLSEGWNMFGYGCPNPIDVIEGLSNHIESILITKDNNGAVYMPEWGFNGIGDFTPGFGYQIKVTEAIEGFSLCDWYVNDIPEDNIVSLQDSLEIINSQIGCTDSLACNFDLTHLYDDGSCDYAEQGFDCEGNITDPFIGMEAYGGIIFYIDESGQHGLVAALEDLGWYEWGCYSTSISGADGTAIGTGYQNTIDILTGCSETPIAASAASNYFSGGYIDWYLPSKLELWEMYVTIGPGSLNGNTGGFGFNYWYFSSSEVSATHVYRMCFNCATSSGVVNNAHKTYAQQVRPIRSF